MTPDEACDDGNVEGGDGCSIDCVIENFWTCDQSNPSQCDGIRGDTLIRGTEACDDGVDPTTNQPVDGDGCSSRGVVELGFDCLGEPSVCVSQCGDGVVASDEWCDDGNVDNTDGCTDTCDAGWMQIASLPGTFSQTHHSFAFGLGGMGYIVVARPAGSRRDDFVDMIKIDDEWTELDRFLGLRVDLQLEIPERQGYFGFGRNANFVQGLVGLIRRQSWTQLASCRRARIIQQ